jgi:hypothetical protein
LILIPCRLKKKAVMEITEEAEKYIRNLAKCRNSYEGELTQVEIYVLLENTMGELQNLLAELKIEWKTIRENWNRKRKILADVENDKPYKRVLMFTTPEPEGKY